MRTSRKLSLEIIFLLIFAFEKNDIQYLQLEFLQLRWYGLAQLWRFLQSVYVPLN